MNLDTWPKPNIEKSNPDNLKKQDDFHRMPPYEQKRTLDKAMKDAELENIERDLSPEVLERIIAKVQNIFEYGTAYSSITGRSGDNAGLENKLESIFKFGLLGRDWKNNRNRGAISDKEWRHDVKNRLNPVHFNIVGRTLSNSYNNSSVADFDNSEPKKAGMPHPRLSGFHSEYSGPYAIIDISSFQELQPIFHEYDNKGSNRTYRINAPLDEVDMTPDSHGKPGVGAEFGFQLSHRLPSRLIKGIAVTSVDDVLKIVKIMNKIFNNPEGMLPIYLVSPWSNHSGTEASPIKTIDEYNEFIQKKSKFSLVWPRKMSHEEALQFIAERDAKNTNKEEK